MTTSRTSPLERLLGVLDRAGERSTAEEVADLLWLAAKLPTKPASKQAVARRAPPLVPPPLPNSPVRESVPPSRGEKFGPSVTSVTSQERGSATASLYPSQAATSAEGGISARLIRSPGAAALPGALDLGRSLRPLKRRVPSRVRMAFDEEATAHRVAASGDWTPVFNPAPERWLDLVLVVDESSSMIIWERTLAELRRLFERQGAFRTIDVLGFRPDQSTADVELYRGIGARAQRDRRVRERSLRDGTARRLIAVVSDCVSAPWHDGRMSQLLAGWGTQHLVAIAQLLPASLWVRTGLRSFPSVYSRSPAPGAPNAQCGIEWTNYKPRTGTRGGSAVPVVSLDATSLDHWARAIAGNSNLWIPAVFAAAPEKAQRASVPVASTTARSATTPTAAQIVRTFYSNASPTALRLASLLAAAPLTLPVMRLVQRAMLPDSRQVHLAEVWLSGLIDRPKDLEVATSSDQVEFAFVSGVREQLLDNLRLGDVVDVLGAVSGYIGERLGEPLDFRALVADPGATGHLQVAQGYQSFARVAANALRRFGGAYADLASRLEVSVYGESREVVERVTQVHVEHGGVRDEPAPRDGSRPARIRALLVGINEHEAERMGSMKGAINDMHITRAWLSATFGVKGGDITMLVDDAATREAVMEAMQRCALVMEPGDQFYFHFCGNDHAIATSDPNEVDGLEETLFLYDSVPGERATLLTHQDLADVASVMEQRGGHVTIVLDCCRAASGHLMRRALRNTIVLAASAEMETAEEIVVDGKSYGALSWVLSHSMDSAQRGATWLDIHDRLLVQLRGRGLRQTPQLIGRGDIEVLGKDYRTVPPYLLVSKSDAHEVEVLSPAPLQLDREEGVILAIYPPGSTMNELQIEHATVARATEHGVVARLNGTATIPPGSRAQLVRTDRAHLLRIEQEDGVYLLTDVGGNRVWQGAPITSLAEATAIIHRITTWLHATRLANVDASPDLREKISVEVAPVPPGEVRPTATSSVVVKVRNRSSENLYVSLFVMDDHLGIERILPSASPCQVLGREREMSVVLSTRPETDDGAPTRLTFKVFASQEPMDLGILTLPRFPQRFDVERLTSLASAPAFVAPPPLSLKKKRSQPSKEWVPGGQIALAAKVWPNGSKLRVRFLDGAPALRKRVMEIAEEWTRQANLRFEVVASGPSDMRVSFKGDGSWSYVGTDSLRVGVSEPTINFGWLKQDTPTHEFRRVVLHEMGHALGLGAANMSPVANIPWRKEATYESFAKQGWDRDNVDTNIFAKYEPRLVIEGGVDDESIMYDAIAAECTEPGFTFHQGTELSAGDTAFIARVYPHVPPASTDGSRSAPPPALRRKSGPATSPKRANARPKRPPAERRKARRNAVRKLARKR